MKRNFLFIASLAVATTMAFGQENLALGGTATAYYDGVAATEGNPGLSIDGNTGTRYEFAAGNVAAANENVAFLLDMGSDKEFNTIQIIWEGAYSKSFTIEVSNNGNDFRNVYTATDEELSGFPVTKNYKVGDQNARYVRFTNVARGTQWGVSFWELGVYNNADAVFTSLNLNAEKSLTKVGEGLTLTATALDQLGSEMDMPAGLTFEVNPVDAGSFNGNVFTATKAGEAAITAKIGEVASAPISVTAYKGDKIDIFSNWQSMVVPMDGTPDSSMVGAFDDNMGSLWDLGGNTEQNWEYTRGFTIDFGALYDLTAVSVTFEGACPADYQIFAINADGSDTEIRNVTGHAGMNTFTDFVIADAKAARGVKFVSTKAATQWGIKIFDFSVYGENKQDMPDTEAPSNFTASVVEGSESFVSVDLALKADDDVSSTIIYAIEAKAEGKADVNTIATGANGAEIVYTLGGLAAGTHYDITVTAKDSKGNATAPIQLSATTSEMTAAPVPTLSEFFVKAIYNDAPYSNIEGLNMNPDWGQPTKYSEIDLDGNKTAYLDGLTYQGIEFPVTDLDGYKTLHIDIYPINTTSIRIVPIWKNVEADANYREVPYDANLEANKWNSLDIPLTAFDSDDRGGKQTVWQIKLDNGNNHSYMLDNIYFAKDTHVGVETIGSDDSNAPVEYFDLNGRRVANPVKGIYISRQGSKVSKIVIR